ncbi:MAG: 6-pyruvoyl trahydropterin synthase family protein [Planctomycetota bacterium]
MAGSKRAANAKSKTAAPASPALRGGFFEVRITGHFCAAHGLRFADGTREPSHGHNFQVAAVARAPQVDPGGMAVDFLKIHPALEAILKPLHNEDLNRLAPFCDPGTKPVALPLAPWPSAAVSPSAEMVARYIFERLTLACDLPARLVRVDVEESPGCFGSYAVER